MLTFRRLAPAAFAAVLPCSPIALADAPALAEFALPPAVDAVRGGVPPAFELVLPIAGRTRTVSLEPVSVRTPGFRALATDANGALLEIEPPAPRTLAGRVSGMPDVRVAGSLLADGLHLLILGAGGETLVVAPDGHSGLHRLAPAVNDLPDGFCGVIDLDLDLSDLEAPAQGGVAGDLCARLVQVAFDADFEFYQSNGSSMVATIADMENVFAGVEAIYSSQLEVPFLISAIVVRTSEPDPYTTNDPSGLLNQVAAEWAGPLAGTPRDVVHLFTGKNLAGSPIGIAFNPGACVGAGYSLSQSKWSLIYNNRVTVCAHELGHNFDANHCNGQPDCGIMCAAVGGCPGGILDFGTLETNQILSWIDAAPCLGPLQVTSLAASAGTVCDAIEITFEPVAEAISHTLWRAPGGAGQNEAQILATNVTSPYVDDTTGPGATFQYWVSTLFADGCESKLAGPVIGFVPNAIGAPNAVIAAEGQSCTQVGVLWSSVNGANGYEVWRGITDDPADALFLAEDSSSPYFDASAQPGVVYRYWVRTRNGCGAPGPFGASDLGSILGAPVAGPPSASDGDSCAAIEVTWDAIPGAATVSLWRGSSPDSGSAALLEGDATSPYVDESIVAGQTYWYFLQGGNACGAGMFSEGDAGSAGLFGDLTGDCVVNGADLGALLSQWGGAGNGDLNGDGVVDGADLGLLTAAWKE